MSQEALRPRCVPWKDWNEWIFVKEMLYSSYNNERKQKGFLMNSVWSMCGVHEGSAALHQIQQFV